MRQAYFLDFSFMTDRAYEIVDDEVDQEEVSSTLHFHDLDLSDWENIQLRRRTLKTLLDSRQKKFSEGDTNVINYKVMQILRILKDKSRENSTGIIGLCFIRGRGKDQDTELMHDVYIYKGRPYIILDNGNVRAVKTNLREADGSYEPIEDEMTPEEFQNFEV